MNGCAFKMEFDVHEIECPQPGQSEARTWRLLPRLVATYRFALALSLAD